MARSRARRPPELSSRDRRILRDLARVRLLSGRQLERLHFTELRTANARGSARRRSLQRLASERLVTTLPRRVGGERAGSAGLVYTLDARAHRQRLLWDPTAVDEPGKRVRRPWSIGWMFVAHSLDVAELYVRLREAEARGELRLKRFDAEPAAWYATEHGVLKPDAFAVIESDGWERHWWVEVDRGTESLPTLRRKLSGYVTAARSGSSGPAGVVPIVLITVRDERRQRQVEGLVRRLPAPAGQLLRPVRFDDAAQEFSPGQSPRPPP